MIEAFRGRLVGVFFSFSFVASLIGIVLGGLAHWRWLFIIPAILALIMASSCYLLGSDILKSVHGVQVSYIKSLQKFDIRKVFLFIFAISFLYHGVHKWYGVYLYRIYDMDKLTISLFFILTVVGGLIGQLIGGVISDLKGRLAACYVGILGLGFGIMILVGIYPLWLLGVTLMGIAMCWTIGHNGVSTVLTDFPDEERPVVASLNSSVRFISGGLGFFATAPFVAKNFGLTFLVLGILILFIIYHIKIYNT